jgi:thiol-disulfide isomerase/thioredoxin
MQSCLILPSPLKSNYPMKLTLKNNLFLSLFLALIIVAVYMYFSRKNKSMDVVESPFFSHQLLSEDSAFLNPDSLLGQVLVVSYFQTWCSDCVKEQPNLLKLQSHFKDQNFKVLMVTDEPLNLVQAFKLKFNSQLDFYQLQTPIKSIGIGRFPTTYLINKKGKVEEVKVEGIEWYTPEIIEKVDALLKG